ncbi:MAG: GNAT family N-acetyltransferase [Aggregatilineales bacterium]|jgi:GNAT superfamily N-acetyltransferase
MALPVQAVPDKLITTYLHMTSPDQFRPGFVDDLDNAMVVSMKAPDVDFYRFLYRSVGEPYRWRDRLLMTDEELEAAISEPGVSVNVLYVYGTPAGYIELAKRPDATEIAYFGLRPGFNGRGLGKHLLSWGIQRAWDDGTPRLWVHTCNLDSPIALSNYLSRGFVIYDTHVEPMPLRYLY